MCKKCKELLSDFLKKDNTILKIFKENNYKTKKEFDDGWKKYKEKKRHVLWKEYKENKECR